MKKIFISLLLSLVFVHAEELPIMILDSLADVYYDAETGNAIASDEIKKLDGQTIRVTGYMVPFNSLENLKEFMLMPSSNGCNFCESPNKEEIIYIKQAGNKEFKFIEEPLVITGKLWVNGAGRKAKNKTHATFLYAFEEAKVEKLNKKHYALLETVTPRTIIKQVCSILKVRLLKQLKIVALDEADYRIRKEQVLLSYLGGETGAKQLQSFLKTMDVKGGESLLKTGTDYLAKWSGAFSDRDGKVIYYRKGLDLSKPENQRQIAIACYDVLFHHEAQMGAELHKGNPSYDEYMARLSLILGLRQSFTQFYGSIGLVDLEPLESFAEPHQKAQLPEPLDQIRKQLLIANAPFIEEVYKAEAYQPYTKAIQAPPSSMKQVFNHSKYTDGKPYKPKVIEGYKNRFGAFLTSLMLDQEVKEESIITDGVTFADTGFTWEILFADKKAAQRASDSLQSNSSINVELRDKTLLITSQ